MLDFVSYYCYLLVNSPGSKYVYNRHSPEIHFICFEFYLPEKTIVLL